MAKDSIATRWQRIMAALIDGLIFLPLVFLNDWMSGRTASQGVIFFYFLVSWQLGWLYSTLLHSFGGQTLGKMFKGIKVVRVPDGNHISYRRAVLRDMPVIVLVLASTGFWVYSHIAWLGGWYSQQHEEWIQQAYAVTIYCHVGWVFLECVSMIFHPQRRAIHDLIAGTIVVRIGAAPEELEAVQSTPTGP